MSAFEIQSAYSFVHARASLTFILPKRFVRKKKLEIGAPYQLQSDVVLCCNICAHCSFERMAEFMSQFRKTKILKINSVCYILT